jgi:hypothetical protein
MQAAARARHHLEAIASAARPAGSAAEDRARAHCADTLRAAGYHVAEEPFEYSAFPGRWATPLVGAAAVGTLAAAGHVGFRGHGGWALCLLAAGLVVLGASSWWAARYGVLSFPALRARATNLVATRGASASPRVWLVAHLDSKSQPVSILVRVGAITTLAFVWMAALFIAGIQWRAELLGGGSAVVSATVSAAASAAAIATWWPWIAVCGAVAGLPVIMSVVGVQSHGALDNASGVVAVLLAAGDLPESVPVGILLTSAEELGLAGARSWARSRHGARNNSGGVPGREGRTACGARGIALNCDGVDAAGTLTCMVSYGGSNSIPRALGGAARANGVGLRVRHLLPGVLVDSVALTQAGWEAATLSRARWRTLLRVHTRRDDIAHLGVEGVVLAAGVLASAAEELSIEESGSRPTEDGR